MITRDALYDFTEALITGSGPTDPLYAAESFRNIRSSVDEADKVVRIECFAGNFRPTSEEKQKEANVSFTAQFWVKPESDEQADMDTATDLSVEMARQFFDAMAANTNLSGLVCDSWADEFETGEANLGSIRRGVTYLDGLINHAS